ncbi:hypothetical protein K461DRAFT_320760 [Myriangium duriaei CBS 260.36]|uniref:MHYT domain-containing protein n=1 Tax=Myriangium duriaei CBS 260.36 TaxID=1168546 RepID=A0A9P4J4F3_9PEZI|nr:hypothetical protein K461DRAFT_320760 [Myriangium duriaei CBS 260.36]
MSLLSDGLRSATDDGMYRIGDVVPWHFEPGLVVASFFASLVGTTLTVELLHRKRLGKSWTSRLQILSCATAMGLIGIWCMHFIGNRSIILGDGRDGIQMTYGAGFTILSCVLPVIGLFFAFYVAELRIKNAYLRRFADVSSGFLAGLAIVGMHYVGNLGASNYKLHFWNRYIVASCVIAIGDCIVALMLFFYFKERWINVFWKRLCCAILLAVAVCGMHFTASIGCTYQLTKLGVSDTARNTAVIVAGVLCLAAALFCLVIIFYTGIRNQQLKDKAQQVSIACAYFDQEGNILVTNEGVLPNQKVAKRFNLQRFDDEFNTSHPTFHWIWKVSNDWGSVSELIPKMRSHLRRLSPESRVVSRPLTAASMESSYDEESYTDETLLFREGFCVAAADLADRMHIKLNQLGNMYDRVTGTGVISSGKVDRKLSQSDAASIASTSRAFEKGQILFFTRVLSQPDIDSFTASGYRLAPPNRVEAMIAKTMQIPIQFVASEIKSLQEYAQDINAPLVVKQGTYLTCFAALGRVSRTFDVLVSKAHQNQLPDMQLTPEHLSSAQIGFLQQYEAWTAGDMVADLKQKRAREQLIPAEVRGFVLLLINSLSALAHQVSEEWFNDLIFSATPIVAHYGQSSSSGTAMIFGLTKLLDIHHGMINLSDRLTFVPLDFFRVRSAFYPGCPDAAKFRSAVHADFANYLGRLNNNDATEKLAVIAGKPVRPGFFRKLTDRNGSNATDVTDDNVSEHVLVEVNPEMRLDSSVGQTKGMWGGILATTDTVIVQSLNTAISSEPAKLAPKITTIAISDNRQEDDKTFADQLYEQAKIRGVARLTSMSA